MIYPPQGNCCQEKGWLTPWAIYKNGRWKFESDDPLVPSWEFPNKSGKVAIYTDDSYVNFVDTFTAVNKDTQLNMICASVDLNQETPILAILDDYPDVPRTIFFTITHTELTKLVFTITGINALGNSVTETFTITDIQGTTLIRATDNAYATITSIVVTEIEGASGGDQMVIGLYNQLGLSNPIAANSIYKCTRAIMGQNAGNLTIPVSKINFTYNTVDINMYLKDGDTYTFWYRLPISGLGV